MTRIETACCCLLASAFVLSGLLLASLSGRLTPQAHAELVVNRDNFTILTARTSQNAESLFVLDNMSEKLLVYKTDIVRKQLKFADVIDLAQTQPDTGTGRKSR
ncbi:MAG: hypothetical protein GC164_03465 [Phycisphaera sp.]|nr:hypothetical protein [Phycisphaera sp.]